VTGTVDDEQRCSAAGKGRGEGEDRETEVPEPEDPRIVVAERRRVNSHGAD
jgi:hypothetical protein